MFGAKERYAKEENFKPSVQSILDCVSRKTKIVFLANPNNPTGTYLNKYEVLKLRKKLRSDILLIIDDAYFEYINDRNYSSGIKLFSKSQNVLVTRTFSKIYGLAGLRIGWGYGPKKIIEAMNIIKPPFNANMAAQLGGAMSVALITTFYGAVLANLLFLPFAEKINSRNKENTIAGELVIEGLCLIHQKKHPILIRDMLNSYIPPALRKQSEE